MDKKFISLFTQNEEYLSKKIPLEKKMQEISTLKKEVLAVFNNLESRVMEEIANIPSPICNHDICLHATLNDSYLDDVYACVSCGSLLLAKEPQIMVIELDGEMSSVELDNFVASARNKVKAILEVEPNVSMEKLIEILDNYLNSGRGNSR